MIDDTPASIDHESARCPRCGYALRGIVESWHDDCPLEGACSECGLAFAWVDILRPRLYPPDWSVEFGRGVRAVGVRCRQTFVRSLMPWRFWAELGMHHPIHARRLVVYVFAMVGVVALSYLIEHSALAWQVRRGVQQRLIANRPGVVTQLNGKQRELASLRSRGLSWWENNRSREKRIEEVEQTVVTLQRSLNSPPGLSVVHAAVDAVFTPFSRRSSVDLPAGFGDYPSPRFLYYSVRYSQAHAELPLRVFIDYQPYFAATVAGLVLGLPVGFVFLPISRRRARVRWGHIARIWAYSIAVPTIACVLWAACFALGHGLVEFTAAPYYLGVLIAGPASTALAWVWWTLAIHRYLRIPHAWAIVPILGCASGAIILGVVWLIDLVRDGLTLLSA